MCIAAAQKRAAQRLLLAHQHPVRISILRAISGQPDADHRAATSGQGQRRVDAGLAARDLDRHIGATMAEVAGLRQQIRAARRKEGITAQIAGQRGAVRVEINAKDEPRTGCLGRHHRIQLDPAQPDHRPARSPPRIARGAAGPR